MLNLAHLLLALPVVTGPQETPTVDRVVPEATRATLEAADPKAQQLWARLTRVGAPARTEPLNAFRLAAEVRTRNGATSKQGKIALSYLGPKGVRFTLDSGRETGRYGTGRLDYWIKDGKEIVVLRGRDYKEGRKQVDEMAVLARNFLALSDLETLEITSLRQLEEPSSLLQGSLKRKFGSRKYTWLAVTTPDLDLLAREVDEDGKATPAGDKNFSLELCLAEPKGDETSLVPVAAVLYEADTRAGRLTRDPILIQLGGYEKRDGFQVPGELLLHTLAPGSPLEDPKFEEKPAQEVYVLQLDLRPAFTLEHFKP